MEQGSRRFKEIQSEDKRMALTREAASGITTVKAKESLKLLPMIVPTLNCFLLLACCTRFLSLT